METGLSTERIVREVERIRPFVKTSKLELILSCRILYHVDRMRKSPYCIIYMKENDQDEFREIARTEYIYDTLHPEWAESVIVEYNPRIAQKIMFEVYNDKSCGRAPLLGEFSTTLAELAQYLDGEFVGPLKGFSSRIDYGDFIIVPGVVSGDKQIVDISFCAHNLEKLSWIHKNDPFLVINRLNRDGSYSVIDRNNVADATQNPVWKTLRMRPSSLCYNNLDHVIRIDCIDYRHYGEHRLIGSGYTTLRKLSHSPLILTKYEADNITGTLNIHHIRVV